MEKSERTAAPLVEKATASPASGEEVFTTESTESTETEGEKKFGSWIRKPFFIRPLRPRRSLW